MREIECPNCGKSFEIDESSYAVILSQVRSQEFNEEVNDKINQINERHEAELKLLEEKIKNQTRQELVKKDTELAKLEAEKNSEISNLKMTSSEEISKLKSQLESSDTVKRLAIAEAVSGVEKERDQLKNDLINSNNEAKIREQSIKEKYEGAIQLKDEEIDRLKDLKAKLSTKMIGETLEQHCENEFNKFRATGFQNAYFEKDNEISDSGNKGDYIFREFDENGTEIVSIMFEMKNENDTTATKHKNEDFLKKLDKDRSDKKCEYAVLVSLLESDSELYNAGIVDVSHRYPKMYVIRPQFFIPMITLLRNAAMNSLKYKNELIVMRNQDIDIANFEKDMHEWKVSWINTIKNAGKKHNDAIEQINKAIKNLEKTRDFLMTSDKHLGSAERKLGDLTVKRLTRSNPTMAKKFEELNDNL